MRRTKKALALGFLGLLSAVPLTSCDTEQLKDNLASTTEGLLPNLYVAIAQVLIFAAVAAIVIAIAYKPLRKKIEQRRKYIEDSVAQADRDRAEARSTADKAEKIVADAQAEAAQIVQKAQSVAEEDRARAQREISASIEQQKLQAHRDIEDERKRIIAEAHEEIVQTAIDASKQILSREISEDDNRKLVDQFIDQISSGTKESDK